MDAFTKQIKEMGFWPSNLTPKTQQQFERRLNAIILKIFENKSVSKAIDAEYAKVAQSLNFISDLFIIKSYAQIIDINIPPYFLKEFQNIDYSKAKSLDGEIIGVGYDGIPRFHNSAIGEFCIPKKFKPEDIIGAVVRFGNFIGTHPSEGKYRWIVRRIHRFRNLRRLFASSTLPLEVFDRSSHIPNIATDPLFWVQYSIAEMENGNFRNAWRFVETATEKAKSKDHFDPHQIETHWAGLTIKEINDEGVRDGIAAKLLEAVKKLSSVIDRKKEDGTFHVSSVTMDILCSDIMLEKIFTHKSINEFCHHLKSIQQSLITQSKSDVSFEIQNNCIAKISEFLISVGRK
jgi:hypothetical protein